MACLEPTAVNISPTRFSVHIWYNTTTDGTIFTSSTLNVSVANAKTISVTTPTTSFVFPSFTSNIFPGQLVISFYKYAWTAYALAQDCSGYTESTKTITIDPFGLVHSSAIVVVPSAVPEVEDPCVLAPYYSLDGLFEGIDPSYFPVDPSVSGVTWNSITSLTSAITRNVSSLCYYFPRKIVRLNLVQNISVVHVGEERDVGFTEEVTGTYGATTSEGIYTTQDGTSTTFQGIELLYFTMGFIRFNIEPALTPVDQTIVTSDANITFTLEALNYENDFRYYFRAVSTVGGILANTLILPGEEVTLITTGESDVVFDFTVNTCPDYVSSEGTVTILRPAPLSLQGSSFIPEPTEEGDVVFTLSEHFTLEGVTVDDISLVFVASRGLFTNTICQGCSSFSFSGQLEDAQTLLETTTVMLTTYLANYDGIRGNASGIYAYSRYLEGSTTAPVNQDDAAALQVIIILYVCVGLFILAILAYLWVNPALRKPLPIEATPLIPKEVAITPPAPLITDQFGPERIRNPVYNSRVDYGKLIYGK